MKKGVIWSIVVIILVAIIGCGAFFGVRSCNSASTTASENNTMYKVSHLKDEYTIGKSILFSVFVTSDVELKTLSYTLNNSTETVIESTSGLSIDNKDEKLGTGKYYIDSGTQMIDTTDMTAGYYVLVIYSTNAAGTRYMVGEPIIIKLNAVAQSAA